VAAPIETSYSASDVNRVLQAQLDAIHKLYGTALYSPSIEAGDTLYSEAQVVSASLLLLLLMLML
jgi:hypothetical protein